MHLSLALSLSLTHSLTHSRCVCVCVCVRACVCGYTHTHTHTHTHTLVWGQLQHCRHTDVGVWPCRWDCQLPPRNWVHMCVYRAGAYTHTHTHTHTHMLWMGLLTSSTNFFPSRDWVHVCEYVRAREHVCVSCLQSSKHDLPSRYFFRRWFFGSFNSGRQ